MNRITLATCLLLVFSAASLEAQGRGVIHGVVVSETGQPLPSAAVAVRRSSDSSLVAGKLTGRDGRFRIDGLSAATYRVEISLIGHASVSHDAVEITEGGEPVNLPETRLASSAIQLEGVTARAERPAMVFLPDRTVYSTRDMPVVAGGTATDALRTIPELEVDGEGKLTTRGTTPKVHINGRPAPMQGEALTAYLQNMPAERIDRIEVIPNPSARYEAEGQGGIVNIVMKEGTSLGLSGSISANSGTNRQRGGNGRLNYQEGRLTLFGGASLSAVERATTQFDLRENLVANPASMIQQNGTARNESLFTSGDFTAEVKASERGTFWGEFRGFRSGNEQHGITSYMHMGSDLLPTDLYDRDSDIEFSFSNSSASAGFRHVTQPGRREYSLELRRNGTSFANDVLSSKYQRLTTGEREELLAESRGSDGGEDQSELIAQADVMVPWTGDGKLEMGYRGSLRDTESDRVLAFSRPLEPTESIESAFRHREEFHSAYVTANRQLGAVGVQLGVRAEHADIGFSLPLTGDSFDHSYASLFPSANLSYQLREGRSLRLSYSKRQDRPTSWALNPINPSTDPLNRFIGNPFLKPRYTHSFTLESSWSGSMGTLRVAPYYRRTLNSWDQIRTVDEDNVSTITWANLASIESYGSSVSANLRQVGRLGGFVSVSGYREVRDASNVDSEFSGSSIRWSGNSNLTMRLTSTLNAQGSMNYMPARDIPQGRVSRMIHSSVGVRQQLLKQKGSVNLTVIDPFDLAGYEFTTFDRTHRQTGRSTWGIRRAMLSFNYNFGRAPQSARRRQAQEEQQAQPEAGQIR